MQCDSLVNIAQFRIFQYANEKSVIHVANSSREAMRHKCDNHPSGRSGLGSLTVPLTWPNLEYLSTHVVGNVVHVPNSI